MILEAKLKASQPAGGADADELLVSAKTEIF